MQEGDICKNGHTVSGDNILWVRPKKARAYVRCRECQVALVKKIENITGRPPEKCAHGKVGKNKCRACRNESDTAFRRRKGMKPQQIGCGPHGYYPAKDCRWCSRERQNRLNWSKGAKPRVYGVCDRHGRWWPRFRQCNECLKVSRARWEKKHRAKLATLDAVERKWEADLAKNDDDKPSAPWNRLKPNERAAPVWAKLVEEISYYRTPCFEKPDQFTDYDDPRFPDEHDPDNPRPMPTKVQAAQMCSGCPLLGNLCGEYAEAQKEDWGVWDGAVFIGGRRQK